jgi:hypothetical protein
MYDMLTDYCNQQQRECTKANHFISETMYTNKSYTVNCSYEYHVKKQMTMNDHVVRMVFSFDR